MTIPRTTAKKLSTDVEFRLVDESFAPAIGELSAKGLAARIARARTARDKYRTLSERQNREARGRAAPRSTRPSASNLNTIKKQQMFDETLARYEKRAAQLGSAASESGTPAAKAGGSSAARSGTTARKASTSPATARKNAASTAKASRTAKAAKAGDTAPKKKAVARRENKAATKGSAAIPTLQGIVRKVAKAAAKVKDEVDAATAPKRSAKAPSRAEGASTRRTRSKASVNPKGPEFARNPHERGRVGSVQKRQQARRDSR